MLQIDRPLFDKAMLDCYDYHNIPASEKSMDLYFRLLIAYDLKIVLDGLESVLRTSKFFPKVSEIIEAIEGKEDDVVDGAYQEAKTLVHGGFHYPMKFKDKISMQTIADMGGLEQFYNKVYAAGEKDTDAYFEFKRIYKKYYKLARAGQFFPLTKFLHGYMSQLPGAKPVIDADLPELSLGYQPVAVPRLEAPKPLRLEDIPVPDAETSKKILELADGLAKEKRCK